MSKVERDVRKCAELMKRMEELESEVSKYPLAIRAQARYGIRLDPCPVCGKMPEMVDLFSSICVMCRDCRISFKASMFLTTPKKVAIEEWNLMVAQIKEGDSIS